VPPYWVSLTGIQIRFHFVVSLPENVQLVPPLFFFCCHELMIIWFHRRYALKTLTQLQAFSRAVHKIWLWFFFSFEKLAGALLYFKKCRMRAQITLQYCIGELWKLKWNWPRLDYPWLAHTPLFDFWLLVCYPTGPHPAHLHIMSIMWDIRWMVHCDGDMCGCGHNRRKKKCENEQKMTITTGEWTRMLQNPDCRTGTVSLHGRAKVCSATNAFPAPLRNCSRGWLASL